MRRAATLLVALGVLALAACAAAWGQATPVTPSTTPPAVTLPADPAVPTTAAPAPATATTTPAAAPAAASSDDGPPAWVVGLIVLGALALLVLVLWMLARLTAWEPRWLPAARHSIGEAGYRTSAGWAEFRDWLRFRR